MAAVWQEHSANTIVHEFGEPKPGRVTEPAREKKDSGFVPELLAQTATSPVKAKTSILPTQAAHERPVPHEEYPMSAGAKQIEGVIAEIMEGSVVIRCKVPEDVELRLPPSLIPNELLSFGTPVSISLEATGGYRMPVVRGRKIQEQPKLPGQSAVEDWLNSL
jgi:hypothetical protein